MRSIHRGLISVVIALGACGSDPVVDLDGSIADAQPADDAQASGDAAPSDGGRAGTVNFSETSIDFGVVVVGSTARRTLVLENTGDAAAAVTLAPPSGRDAEFFARVIPGATGDSFEVPAGARVTIDVTVTPTTSGALVASLAGDACDGRCPIAITLVAEAAVTGVRCDLAVSFGTLHPGSCRTIDAHCTNAGNVAETISAVALDAASDAAFVVAPIMLPTDLAVGAQLVLPVELCATMGTHTGALVVESTSPNAATHRITLNGRAGGGQLSCTPPTLDFGPVALGASTDRTLLCQNVGIDPLAIARIASSHPDFAAPAVNMVLQPSETLSITVSVSGTALGAITGELLISTDDPELPETAVPLRAEVVDLSPCAVTLSPQTLDFGLVAAGDRRSAGVVVTNTGTTDCLMDRVDVTPASAFTATLPAATRLAPGATQSIAVAFVAPTAAGTSTASLELSFVNPGSPPASALLVGASGATRIVIEPAVIDFGEVPAMCAAPSSRRVVVRSISTTPVVLSRLALGGTSSAAFALIGAPANRTLAPFASIALDVEFAPSPPGAYSAQLEVGVAGQAGLTLAPISGRAAGAPTRTDRFTAGAAQLDLLFVTDDSASMAAAQAALAAATPQIAQSLSDRGVSFHFGVVTTDLVDPTRSGRLQGMPPVLDDTTPDLADTLAARLAPGTNGDGASEQGITAAHSAVTPPLNTTDNAGFLRPGADLAIVILSDEDDHGGRTDLAAVMADLRGASGSGRVQVSVIVGPATGNCSGPQGNASAAPRYHELARRSDDGLVLSFCAPTADNVTQMMAAVLGDARFTLSAMPLVSTLAVGIDGVALPAMGALGPSWRYDTATNTVVLRETPPAGATVSIAYTEFCLTLTCGDGMQDAREQCDDGNQTDDDACVSGCVLARCGDGFAQAGVEDCDDGNLVDTDACTTTCATPVCGDGFVQAGVEDCDDGNTLDGDTCPANCDLRLDFDEWYTISGPTSAVYLSLTAGTPLVFADPDDGFAELSLPFPFTLFDVTTSSITVSPNGFVALDGLAGVGGAFANGNFPSAAAPNGILAVWWEDLVIDANVTGGAAVRYQIQGTAPARVVVIEWLGVRVAPQHSTNNNRRFNMQLALSEGTNVIAYRYGETQTSGNPPTATTASVGLEDVGGTIGAEALTCTPNCAGPARPQNANGFPRQSAITITPL